MTFLSKMTKNRRNFWLIRLLLHRYNDKNNGEHLSDDISQVQFHRSAAAGSRQTLFEHFATGDSYLSHQSASVSIVKNESQCDKKCFFLRGSVIPFPVGLCYRQVAILLRLLDIRVARWFIFKPKIPIWVNFGGP
jgi:hypothetical protein